MSGVVNKEKQKQYSRERREWLKSIGYCPRCGKQKLVGKEKTCPECLAKAYVANLKRKNTEKYLEQQKERRKRLIENNLCCQCGKNELEVGKTYCTRCLTKKRIRARSYQERKGLLPRSERYSEGLCYRCGKTLDSDKRLCSKCCIESARNFKGIRATNHPWKNDNELLRGRFT